MYSKESIQILLMQLQDLGRRMIGLNATLRFLMEEQEIAVDEARERAIRGAKNAKDQIDHMVLVYGHTEARKGE